MPGRMTFSRKENNNMSAERLKGDLNAELTGVSAFDAIQDDGPCNGSRQQHKAHFKPDQDIFQSDYIAFDLRFGGSDDH
ncbi:hypothetical protein D3C81_1636480 [compost metagenome]